MYAIVARLVGLYLAEAGQQDKGGQVPALGRTSQVLRMGGP